MEAITQHDFVATADDELSFKRGCLIKILSKDDDANWYKAEIDGKEGYVPNNYIEMKPHSWYGGKLGRAEGERRLLEKDSRSHHIHIEGAFLVRNCESALGEFAISVKVGEGVQHFKILRDGAGKYFLWVVKFNSINELVEYHRMSSVNRDQNIILKDMTNTSQKSKANALFDFVPQTTEEVGFRKGDSITILEEVDQNWWKGEVNGVVGLFPAAYCRLI